MGSQDAPARRARLIARALALWPAVALVAGAAAWVLGAETVADGIWAAGVVPVLLALVVEVAVSLRRGEVGLDIVALLSMSGALALGEALAGNVIALMYAGGQLLENFADNRARREMTALLARAPKTAMVYRPDGLREVATDTIEPGDKLLIRNGDVVPVDGTVAGAAALLDEATLTGESLPVRHGSGQPVMSGSVNVDTAFDLVATRRAADSAYAAIVHLVEAAQRLKAPMVRIADRYALWFLLLTVVMAGGAWLMSGDPVRALAVLVVATPCPLILAVPVAIIAGVSLAARHGVLVKGGGVLERFSRVTRLVIDKTGTLTHGRAALVAVNPVPGFAPDRILRLAASLDQASNHILAEALVEAARQSDLPLAAPTDVREAPGSGIEGRVDGRDVVIGGLDFVRGRFGSDQLMESEAGSGDIVIAVAVDGRLAGTLILADQVRPEVPELLARFRRQGIRRIVLATGDRPGVANAIGAKLGLDAVLSALSPEEKVAAVVAERQGGPVMMIGDGVNDAPALAAADVGVAMGARGAAPSSEAADAVILVDRLDRVAEVIDVARRARRIALQSVYVGIGLSVAAMVVAMFGYLPPVEGALLQEVIDVAVILNALRALRDPHPPAAAAGGTGQVPATAS